MRRWKGNGILAQAGSPHVVERLIRSGIPCVDVYGRIKVDRLPHVGGDDLAIGGLAAEHLLQRELKQFAYFGYAGVYWSERRYQGFFERLKAAGFECDQFISDKYHDVVDRCTPSVWERHQQMLANWISNLPKPVGIMATTDPHAQQVLDACRRANVLVPEEAAVIGVDNDEEICRLCSPPLSSVAVNPRRVGFEGARLLHQLMTGAISADQAKPIYIRPQEVVTRLSTELTAIDDKIVAEAVSYIRKRACEGIQVDDVAGAVKRSRTSLYRLFDSVLGRSPYEEILRIRFQRVKSLLVRTTDTLEEIAYSTGFCSAAYLSVAFKREVRMTPGEFRIQNGPRNRVATSKPLS